MDQFRPHKEVFDESLERALLEERLDGRQELVKDIFHGFHARALLGERQRRQVEYQVLKGDMEIQFLGDIPADTFHILGDREGYGMWNDPDELKKIIKKDGQNHKYVPKPQFFTDSRLFTAGKYTPISLMR